MPTRGNGAQRQAVGPKAYDELSGVKALVVEGVRLDGTVEIVAEPPLVVRVVGGKIVLSIKQ